MFIIRLLSKIGFFKTWHMFDHPEIIFDITNFEPQKLTQFANYLYSHWCNYDITEEYEYKIIDKLLKGNEKKISILYIHSINIPYESQFTTIEVIKNIKQYYKELSNK